MKLKDLLIGVEILEMHADPEMEISQVVYDSRKKDVKPGSLFVAISGFTFDGNDYIPAMMEKHPATVDYSKMILAEVSFT